MRFNTLQTIRTGKKDKGRGLDVLHRIQKQMFVKVKIRI